MVPTEKPSDSSPNAGVSGISGWRPAEVVVLFGLAFTAQGLALVFGDTLEADKVSELVRRGTFDQVLTRPTSPLGWVVASYVDTRFVGRALAGAATVAWATDRAGVAWTPGRAGLAEEITGATRLVIVCNPNNPTSTALPLDDASTAMPVASSCCRELNEKSAAAQNLLVPVPPCRTHSTVEM